MYGRKVLFYSESFIHSHFIIITFSRLRQESPFRSLIISAGPTLSRAAFVGANKVKCWFLSRIRADISLEEITTMHINYTSVVKT